MRFSIGLSDDIGSLLPCMYVAYETTHSQADMSHIVSGCPLTKFPPWWASGASLC